MKFIYKLINMMRTGRRTLKVFFIKRLVSGYRPETKYKEINSIVEMISKENCRDIAQAIVSAERIYSEIKTLGELRLTLDGESINIKSLLKAFDTVE